MLNAQQYLINFIPAKARVLIIGGGTGWILEEIAHVHPSELTIVYIDVSPKMISLAKKRNAGNNKVTFITSQVQDVHYSPEEYDIVLTPFLFDNFTDDSLQKIFPEISKGLKRGGLWLHCDFEETGRFTQRFLLKVMYFFFRVCCGIEASGLPDVSALFSRYEYKISGRKTYMKGFIAATIYRRE